MPSSEPMTADRSRRQGDADRQVAKASQGHYAMNTDTAISRDSQPVLVSLAKCQGCGSPMTVSNGDADHVPRYVCANAIGAAGNPCDAPNIEAKRLDELVVDHLVARVLTDDLLKEVITQVRLDAAQRALQQQRHLSVVQDKLDSLERDRTKLITEVADGETSYPELSDQLDHMGDSWRSIKDEARQAERILEGYQYVATEEDRVASYARNPDTYLRQMNATATRGLLEMLIEEILVTADSADVVYKLPLPLGSAAGEQHSVIPL